MKDIQFYKEYGKLNNDDLEKFEEEYDLNLPDDYRTFLKAHNGGLNPLYQVVRIELNSNEIMQAVFYTFYGIGDIPRHARMRFVNEKINGHGPFLSIGDDSTNDTFLMSLREPDYGTIYFWEPVLIPELIMDGAEKNVYPVAETFSAFIDNLLTVKQYKELQSTD